MRRMRDAKNGMQMKPKNAKQSIVRKENAVARQYARRAAVKLNRTAEH